MGAYDLKDKGVCIPLETEMPLYPKNNNGSLSYASTIVLGVVSISLVFDFNF